MFAYILFTLYLNKFLKERKTMIRELHPTNRTKLVNTYSEFQRIIIIFAGQKTFRVCVPYSCSKIVSPENYIETVVQSVIVSPMFNQDDYTHNMFYE